MSIKKAVFLQVQRMVRVQALKENTDTKCKQSNIKEGEAD
jgi:hypothetical protein